MFVPAWQVIPFNMIKKPFFSSLWYSVLVYTIWDPKETLPTVLGIAFLLLSFTKFRFFLAMLSPLPCIAAVILSWQHLVHPYPIIITVAGIIWLIMYVISMFIVNARLNLGQYVISPVTNRMMYDTQYYMMKGLKK